MAINTTTQKGIFPDKTFIAKELIPEALIFKITTTAGGIEGDAPQVRVPFVSVDPTAGFVLEGADLTATDPTLSEILISTGKIALLTKVSREASTYVEATDLLSASTQRAVILKGNVALLANPVTAQQPTGLLNTVGIVDGGTLDPDNLDAIADAITSVEVNGGTATHIVCDPASFGILRLMKVATGSNSPLLGAPGEGTGRTLFGVPVLTDASMPSGTVLVVDQTNVISAVGLITVSRSEDYYFNSDSIALRLTWRIGHRVIRPNRLAKVTVTITP